MLRLIQVLLDSGVLYIDTPQLKDSNMKSWSLVGIRPVAFHFHHQHCSSMAKLFQKYQGEIVALHGGDPRYRISVFERFNFGEITSGCQK
jgi:hypothetical protein